LVKKRSDFEHRVFARGSKAVDFARYAAWEISLETLRQKRCKRLRIKGEMDHSGQARIFDIFDRGTKKHPGDVALWMSFLECARKAKATKKFKTVLTAAIRLQPTKSEFWLYAARWALETDADMGGARSYMQRGTRFCIRSKDLWIEYAKLEMIYLAKIAMRRQILGLDIDRTIEEPEETVEDMAFDPSADEITFSDVKMHSLKPSMIEKVEVDAEAAKDPINTPALQGAIPLAIFDAARKQPFFNASAAADFFNMFTVFTQVRCLPKILRHVLDSMRESYPIDPSTCNCYIRQPVVGVNLASPEFPLALGTSLERLKEELGRVKERDRAALVIKTKAWIGSVLAVENLDHGIRTVLEHTIRKL
jgi:U3 small nucleolar RNA-associated protein 6